MGQRRGQQGKAKRMEVNEMRMLRWMCGVTKNNKIRNEHGRGYAKVAPVTKKITEKKLKWYGHVRRRGKGHVLSRILNAPVPGKRRRGKQNTRRKDSCKRHMERVKGGGRTGQDKVGE